MAETKKKADAPETPDPKPDTRHPTPEMGVPWELRVPWVDRPDCALVWVKDRFTGMSAGGAYLPHHNWGLSYAADGFCLVPLTDFLNRLRDGVGRPVPLAEAPDAVNTAEFILYGSRPPRKRTGKPRLAFTPGDMGDGSWRRSAPDDDPAHRWAVCCAVPQADARVQQDGKTVRPGFRFARGSHRYPELAGPAPGVDVADVRPEYGQVVLFHPRVLFAHDGAAAWGNAIQVGAYSAVDGE